MEKKTGGIFIVLEGPDKSGKSTQAQALIRHLRSLGRQVLWTREPGGTPLAESVRAVLLNPLNNVSPLAELLLYEASRAQHVEEKILPALKAGAVVVCERFTMSTAAYQGYGRGLDLGIIERLNKTATAGLEPDLTVVFDMPEKLFPQRCRKKAVDRLELEPEQFRTRVRRGYRELARRDRRVVRIDAAKPLKTVQQLLWKKVDRLIGA